MTRTSVAAAVLALAGLSLVAGARPVPFAPADPGVPVVPPAVPDDILYDQDDKDMGVAVVSQNFAGSAFDAFDSQAADDFTVPPGEVWKIALVDITGRYIGGPGPASSVNVFVYKNDARRHMPGPILMRGVYLDRALLNKHDQGSFTIHLHPPLKLKGGKWWIAVKVNMGFNTAWGWENRIETRGFPAAWVNPKDGFGTGCTEFEAESTCLHEERGDHMFKLRGTIVGDEPD